MRSALIALAIVLAPSLLSRRNLGRHEKGGCAHVARRSGPLPLSASAVSRDSPSPVSTDRYSRRMYTDGRSAVRVVDPRTHMSSYELRSGAAIVCSAVSGIRSLTRSFARSRSRSRTCTRIQGVPPRVVIARRVPRFLQSLIFAPSLPRRGDTRGDEYPEFSLELSYSPVPTDR